MVHARSRQNGFVHTISVGSRRKELRRTTIPIDRMAVILHDSLTGDILYRLLAGVGKHENDAQLERLACAAVDIILGNVRSDMA
jgi:hypothetical protein